MVDLDEQYNKRREIKTFDDIFDEEDEVTAESLYGFDPDKSVKKLIKALNSDDIVKVLNELCKTNFPKGCSTEYLKTEHLDATGGKNFILGDLVMKITPPPSYKGLNTLVKGSPYNWKKLDHSYIVALELQTSVKTGFETSDQEPMGFRVFLYAINTVEKRIFKVKNKKKILYVLPKGATIYTVAGMPESGVDEVYLQFDEFRVRKHKFSASKGDALVLEFPYVNILEIDIKKLEKSVYSMFLTVYLYKFRQKPNLMLKDDFQEILEIVEKGMANFEGDEELRVILSEIHQNLKRDLKIKLKKEEQKENNKKDDYRKAMKTMQQVELSYGERKVKALRDILRANFMIEQEERERKLLQEQEKRERKLLQEQAKEQAKVIKNLLPSLTNEEISRAMSVELTYVEQIRAKVENNVNE